MRKNTLIIALFLATGINIAQAQNQWTQKVDFGGTGRSHPFGFSIGSKGYIGTGTNDIILYKDFWEYDPDANTWTQKADFGGTARMLSTGFSIGSKGYVGTGQDNSGYTKDFWEYDPDINAWAQKANFGGTARWRMAGFSIGSKGYMGTGYDGSFKNDFWEYDPGTNTWTQKASFGGTGRESAVGFSIGSKGYLGTGGSNFGAVFYNDFWEFDPSANNWTKKANFGGSARIAAVGFAIGDNGYIGTGANANSEKKDLWEYNPLSNTWTERANFGGAARHGAAGFAINSKGYIGTGYTTDGLKNDFWEYTPETSTPTCAIPGLLTTVNITPTTAKLKWLAINGVLSYKVRYKIAGTSEWTITKALNNSKTLYGLTASTEYVWQVKSFCEIKPVVTSDWSEEQFFTTDELRLSGQTVYETMFELYPNPVSQSTTISFFLNEESPVVIEIMDVNGRSLRVIVKKDFSKGTHEVTFNRESLSAGVYFIQLKTNEGVRMKKIVVE